VSALDLGAAARPGGTEYELPRNATAAFTPACRDTMTVAGYGAAGRASSGSAPASAPTVDATPLALRGRASAVPEQNASSEAWACAGVAAVIVRHHRPQT
jgi:hypothetical protein